jgi:hypothetical protein
MAGQAPSVGRIVHYRSLGSAGGRFASECRAAVVTEVGRELADGAERVGLAVLNPSGLFFDTDIPQDEAGKAAGTWHWPERV